MKHKAGPVRVTGVSTGAHNRYETLHQKQKKTGGSNVNLSPNEKITNPKVMSAPLLARWRAVVAFRVTVGPKL